MNPLSPIHPTKRPLSSPAPRFGETSQQDSPPDGTGEYREQSGGLSVADLREAGVDPLQRIGQTRQLGLKGVVGGDGASDSLFNADFQLNLSGTGSKVMPKIVLPGRLASADSAGEVPGVNDSAIRPIIQRFRDTGGASTSVQALRQANVTTSVGQMKPATSDTPVDQGNPAGTVDYVPVLPKDQGTVDYVPIQPHEVPTGVYIPGIESLDFNPITADYTSDEMRHIIFGDKRLSVPDITKYVVNHPEFEKRLRSPLLKVMRYEDRTPVYSSEPETDAIDLIKLTDEDVAYVKTFFTLDANIPDINTRPKRQTSAYLDLIRQTDIARFKRATVDEYYRATPEELEMKPDEEAMRKRLVLMKAYRALGQRFTSLFDNTIASDLSFDSMFPPGKSVFSVSDDDSLHTYVPVRPESMSGAALYTDDEINEYRAKEVPPMTSSEQIELAKIRQEMRRGQRNTMLALAASVFLAVSGALTAGYFATRPSTNNTPDANALASLTSPDLDRQNLNPPRNIGPTFDPNAPKADDVLIDPANFKEMDKILAQLDRAPISLTRYVVGGKPQTIDRTTLHPLIQKQHPDVPLHVVVTGSGSGHVIDLTDNPGQLAHVKEFGPGDVEIRGALITVLDKTSNTRIYSGGQGPYYGFLLPLKSVVNMKSIEFEGTHIVCSGEGSYELTRASDAEILALRNPKLTQKVTLRYADKKDEIVMFTYPGIQALQGRGLTTTAPDVARMLGLDKARTESAAKEEDLLAQINGR